MGALLILRRLWAAIGWEFAIAGVLALALAWQTFAVQRLHRQLAEARADTVAEVAAHQRTKDTYRIAQESAARMEAQRILRVQAEQRTITDDVTKDFQRRLADARAAAAAALAGRVRPESGTGADRAPGGQPVPAVPAAAGGIAAAPGAGLPAAADLAWRLKAQEQAIQLDALITWVQAQAGVNLND